MGTESWVITAPQNIEVGEVRALSVHLTAGSVEVVGAPERERGASIEVLAVSDRPLHVTTHDGELKVSYDFAGVEGLIDRVRGLRDKDSATVRVTVPAHVAVKVATVGASVRVAGTQADVSVGSVDGAVQVEGTTGALSVRTASARVGIVEHRGDVRATTASGWVDATGDLGRVTVSTVSGGVVLAAARTTPLVNVKTVSGDVLVRLGEGVGVNVRARSVTGKVVLDGSLLPSSSTRVTSVDHTVGTSGAYLSTSTVSGALTISRGAEAA